MDAFASLQSFVATPQKAPQKSHAATLRPGLEGHLRAHLERDATTRAPTEVLARTFVHTRQDFYQRVEVVGRPVPVAEPEATSSIPLQIWEGVVTDVDLENEVFTASLVTKLRPIPDHTVEIGLEWVAEQDHHLLTAGAVFYLTLYKAIRRGGTIQNAQELRFRRVPDWTKSQVQEAREQGKVLLSRLRSRPISAE